MRLSGILILIICFSSCKPDKLKARVFTADNYILVDSATEADEFLPFDEHINDYPIYYVGPPADTIKIGKRYWRGKTPWIDNERPGSRDYSDKTLRVFVDTTIRTNCPVEYFSEYPEATEDSTVNYHAFLFSITNISEAEVYLGPTFSVVCINREARDKQGNWIIVDKKLSQLIYCGTGEPNITLTPKDVLISKMMRYKGSFVTDFRLALGYGDNTVYSNVFRDSIDERTLHKFF